MNKKSIFKVVKIFLNFIVLQFYNKKYIKGKYFDNSLLGWKWAFKGILWQKIFGFNRHIDWPVSPFITINNKTNIIFDPDDINNFQAKGTTFQNFAGKIVIGKGTYIANNVGIITSNHNPMNLEEHDPPRDVIIGKGCWLGMNSVLLPGVVLGDRTVVGAGSIVTKSFPEGGVILVGNPARVLRVVNEQNKQDN